MIPRYIRRGVLKQRYQPVDLGQVPMFVIFNFSLPGKYIYYIYI